MNAPTPKWIDVVGILWIGSGILGVLSGLVFLVMAITALASGTGAAVQMAAEAGVPPEIASLYVTVLPIAIGIGILLSAFEVVVGIGLYKRAVWAWWVGIALAPLSLIDFPIGTVLGVATLFVLVHPGLRRHFSAVEVPG